MRHFSAFSLLALLSFLSLAVIMQVAKVPLGCLAIAGKVYIYIITVFPLVEVFVQSLQLLVAHFCHPLKRKIYLQTSNVPLVSK